MHQIYNAPVDELNDIERSELKAALLALVDELSEVLRISADGDQPVDLGQPIGRVSRIDAIAQQALRKSNRRGIEARLRLANAALQRIDSDSDYGMCTSCEEPIGFRRLRARPESRLCLSCQTFSEQSGPSR